MSGTWRPSREQERQGPRPCQGQGDVTPTDDGHTASNTYPHTDTWSVWQFRQGCWEERTS